MTAEPKLPYHHGQCDIRIVHLTDFDLWMRRSSIALENEIYTRHMPSKETRRSSRKKFKYSAPFKVRGNKRGSTISFSIIPAQMFTLHVSWKCVSAMMCGFVVDHQRVLCTLKILLRLFIKHTTRNVNQYNFAQALNDKKFPLDQNHETLVLALSVYYQHASYYLLKCDRLSIYQYHVVQTGFLYWPEDYVLRFS